MKRFYSLFAACINVTMAGSCSEGDSICQSLIGEESFCLGDLGHCHGSGGSVVPCNCGIVMSSSNMRGSKSTGEVDILDIYIDESNNESDTAEFRKLASDPGTVKPSTTPVVVGTTRKPVTVTTPRVTNRVTTRILSSNTTAVPTTTLRPITRTTTLQACAAGDAFCRTQVGVNSYCKHWNNSQVCQGSIIPCSCNPTASTPAATTATATTTLRITSIVVPTSASTLTTMRITTTVAPTSASTRVTTAVATTVRNTTTPVATSTSTPSPVATAVVTTMRSTSSVAPTSAGTVAPVGPVVKYDDGMYVWAEWPSMWGEPDWVKYYAKLVNFAKTSPMNVNKIILRVIDPIHGTAATTSETTRDLWTVSTDSVVYTEFFSKLPASVPVFELYPYLMDKFNQDRWTLAMNTSLPLEATFKMCAQWNSLFNAQGLTVRCRGVTVDGEERRGYVTEYTSISTYKERYGGLTFGYSTGYSQVGVLRTHDSFVDDVYFQMYDFYVRGVYPAQLVMNTDVATDDVMGYVSLLNSTVWYQQMPYYEHPKARFMWSTQHSGNGNCFYPMGPTDCGAKEDFGAWSLPGFISFVNTVRTLFPTKFGNKGHGIFQFSLVPNAWNVTV